MICLPRIFLAILCFSIFIQANGFSGMPFDEFESIWLSVVQNRSSTLGPDPFSRHSFSGTPTYTFSRDDFRAEFPSLVQALRNCPIKETDRLGGMMTSHSLGLWTVLRKMKPQTVIESGVHRGFSTWLIRQALPTVKIYSIDPVPFHWMTYRDPNATYFNEDNFKDFRDINWKSLQVDPASTLILFDDHMNHMRRIREAKQAGFRFVMFDDNYVPFQGDAYSLKQMFQGDREFYLSRNLNQVTMLDEFGKVGQNISLDQHMDNAKEMRSTLVYYYEVPPVLWYSGYYWTDVQENYSPHQYVLMHRTLPLFSSVSDMQLYGWRPPIANNPEMDLFNYQSMCFIEIKQ